MFLLLTTDGCTEYQNKFQPPPASHHIRLRVQDYMGEPHPANNKVTLSLSIPKLGLSSSEAHNFKLIAGPRWDSTNDTFTISCDSEQSREGNVKWCSDVLERLISEAKVIVLSLTSALTDKGASINHRPPHSIYQNYR